TFTPTIGASVSDSVSIVIDTQKPALVAGAVSEQGPLFSRALNFNKNLDSSTISAASIQISGPGIAGSINPAQLFGSGSSYTLVWTNRVVEGGTYTVSVASSVADIAGNTVGAGAHDTFQLIADTTAPTITSVIPSGPTSNNVSSLTVDFSEAIKPATFS